MTGSDRGEHSGSDDARTDVFLVQLDELVNTEDIGARLPVPGDLHAVLDEAQVTIRRLRARVAELETAGSWTCSCGVSGVGDRERDDHLIDAHDGDGEWMSNWGEQR